MCPSVHSFLKHVQHSLLYPPSHTSYVLYQHTDHNINARGHGNISVSLHVYVCDSFEKLTSGTTCIDLSSIAVKRVWSRDAIFLVWYAVHDLHIYPLHEKQKFVACSSSFSLEQSSQCISFGWSTIFYSMVFSGKSSTHVCVYKGSPSLGMLTRQSGQRNPKRGSVDLHWLIM